MAQLQDIKPSLSELDPLARMVIHKSIRSSRLVAKAPPTKAAAKRKQNRKDVYSMVQNMTPEQAAALIKMLKKD